MSHPFRVGRIVDENSILRESLEKIVQCYYSHEVNRLRKMFEIAQKALDTPRET